MAKNIFATFGILAVLLLSIGMVCAAAEDNNFSISVEGIGTSETNPVIGEDGDSVNFVVNFTNNNLDYPSVNLSWDGTAISSGSENDTGNTTFSPTVDISSSGSSYGLTVLVTNSTGDVIATLTKPIYYLSNTTIPVSGCTNVSAINYDSDAVTDDGSCEFSFMCKVGEENPAKLSISIEEINVEEGFGDDDDYWYPLDEVEIEIEVVNDGNNDVENIEITFCLYDEDKEKCILDEDDVDLDEDDFDLDDGDEQTVVISFQVDPDDLSDNNNYDIRVGATGEIDSKNDLDGNDSCIEDNEPIEIITNDNFVILNDIRFEALSGIFGEDEFLAGSQVKISGEVWNVGNNDLDDDEVFLEIYSSLLGINEVIEFDSGIDSLDMETFEKVITIPADAEEKFYKITFTVYEDDKLVEKYIFKNSEDDKAEQQEIISVKANVPTPSVKANLDSVAEVGEELVVKAMITNNGEDNDFEFKALNLESWAELVSVSPQTVTIAEGESVEVTFVLNPTKEGTQSFMINTIVDGESYKQAVSVKIAEKEGFFTELGLSDTMTYIVIAIIALVILILLVLIAKASRRPAKPQF